MVFIKSDDLPIQVKPGAVRVQYATVLAAGEEVLAVELGTGTRWTHVSAVTTSSDGVPGVCLVPRDEEATDVTGLKNETRVEFPELTGWFLFSLNPCKGYHALCFLKRGGV